MALRLQFLTVVVPRAAFARCPDLGPALLGLLPDGGYLLDTNWYDAHLWCETAMNDVDAGATLELWEDLGLRPGSGDGQWQDLCLAASGQGPLGPCPWLQYDPATNSIWLAGTEPGAIIGGEDHRREVERVFAEAEAAGEAAYARMYDTRRSKDDFEEACLALGRAQAGARFLGRPDEAVRLAARLEPIRGVYQAQFRGW